MHSAGQSALSGDRSPRSQLMTSATEYAPAGNPGSTAPVRVQNRSWTSGGGFWHETYLALQFEHVTYGQRSLLPAAQP
jgi:hypothetical protein